VGLAAEYKLDRAYTIRDPFQTIEVPEDQIGALVGARTTREASGLLISPRNFTPTRIEL
jgi:hypothetical protein